MFDLILYAIPFFLASLSVEWVSFRHTGDHDHDRAPGGDLLGYDAVDTATSLTMGVGNVVINVGWKLEQHLVGVGAAVRVRRPRLLLVSPG
jgi:hypothetical protein